jgi:hypothetical protein
LCQAERDAIIGVYNMYHVVDAGTHCVHKGIGIAVQVPAALSLIYHYRGFEQGGHLYSHRDCNRYPEDKTLHPYIGRLTKNIRTFHEDCKQICGDIF